MIFLFESANFVVADKPAGVLTTPSRFQEKDTRQVLGLIIQQQLGHPIFPIHRLDFEVSGLVLFAKNANAHRVANGWFENRLVEKTYFATTECFKERPAVGAEFLWQNKIVRGKRRSFVAEHGQPSETVAIVGSHSEGRIHWILHPKTGRPHQLRLHLSMHGFPILGDLLYGSTIPFEPDMLALRAVELNFKKIKDRLDLPELIQIPHVPKGREGLA